MSVFENSACLELPFADWIACGDGLGGSRPSVLGWPVGTLGLSDVDCITVCAIKADCHGHIPFRGPIVKMLHFICAGVCLQVRSGRAVSGVHALTCEACKR